MHYTSEVVDLLLNHHSGTHIETEIRSVFLGSLLYVCEYIIPLNCRSSLLNVLVENYLEPIDCFFLCISVTCPIRRNFFHC